MIRGRLGRAALALLAFGAAMIATGAATASVPSTIGFTARLIDESSGAAVAGPHQIAFALFDREAGGTAVWQEAREVTVVDGLLLTELGQITALDATIFDGRKLWLEVTLDEVVMDPRMALDSVPYAIRAGVATDADAVGGMPAEDVQHRVTGTCGAGNFLIGVNPDGTVVCAPDLTGSGDVTAVFAGTGLQGGGNSGEITLSLNQTCLANQILKWNGTAWVCAADAGGTAAGDITGVTVGPAGGLIGGGASGDVMLSLLATCATNQVLKWNGATWGCANDADTDTNSGGDITSVTTAIGTGLQGGASTGDAALSMLTTCAAGQLLKWNGTAWACANDIDTDTNAGGDISGVTAGAGLSGGGTVGAVTLNVAPGPGISVAGDVVALDTGFGDARYVNQSGDTMAGALNMNGFRVTNRGCPTGYVLIGPGLCTENTDASAFTFTGCANRCRQAGTHMCSSGEMRAILSSGVSLAATTLLDWVDDQDADGSALYVAQTVAEDPDQARPTTSASFCRCCASIE